MDSIRSELTKGLPSIAFCEDAVEESLGLATDTTATDGLPAFVELVVAALETDQVVDDDSIGLHPDRVARDEAAAVFG